MPKISQSEEENYFAFMEHQGQIELVWWAKTPKECRSKAVEWAKFSKLHGETEVTFGVAHIEETIEYKPKSVMLRKSTEESSTGVGDGSNPKNCSNLPIERQQATLKHSSVQEIKEIKQ
jgi:hypothetical protein